MITHKDGGTADLPRICVPAASVLLQNLLQRLKSALQGCPVLLGASLLLHSQQQSDWGSNQSHLARRSAWVARSGRDDLSKGSRPPAELEDWQLCTTSREAATGCWNSNCRKYKLRNCFWPHSNAEQCRTAKMEASLALSTFCSESCHSCCISHLHSCLHGQQSRLRGELGSPPRGLSRGVRGACVFISPALAEVNVCLKLSHEAL